MRFPPAFLDDIRARLPISQVVGRRVTWDKRKTNPARGDYWACCPFHGEKTPSFHADNRKGRYHCFGCGASGDHFRFLVEAEGLSFPEAVSQLAGEAGVPLPARDPDYEKREAERASLHEVVEKAARFFEAALQGADGGKARAYLREREIPPETQKRFRIGYAPSSRNALKEHLAGAGIDQDQMIEAGLIVAGEDIPVSYDRFRDRIIFPITDYRGRVIAFGGRALGSDVQPKYLNSPETPLFHKSHVLYNGQAARAAASSRGARVVAVEGYIDVIACVTAGVEAVVAPLGTALTEDQLRMLWQMADEPILCFDGDDAGLKAAFRAIDLAMPNLKPGKSIRFALLSEGEDPDSLIRKEGPEALRKALDATKPLVEMLWLRAAHGQELDTPERRAGIEQALRTAVAGIADPDVRRHYEAAIREQAARRFGPAQRAPRRSFGPPSRKPWGKAAEPTGPSPSLLTTPLVRERGRGAASGPSLSDAVLTGVLLMHPEIAEERLESLAGAHIGSAATAALAEAMATILAETPGISASDLNIALEGRGHGRTISEVMEKLRRTGLGGLNTAESPRAAAIWDDAAHLRLRAGTLSIERQAAATALGRDVSEVELSRLRDIQEQDQRNLRPVGRDEAEETVIVHPFKRR